MPRRAEQALLHQEQADDHRDERDRVHPEALGEPDRRDEHAADRRTDDPGGVEEHRVERDGVDDLVAADHLDDERLASRVVEGVDEAEDRREHVDVPELDPVRGDEDGQDERLDHRRRLGDQQHPPLRQAVDDHPGEEGEDRHRQELEGGDGAERERRVGEPQDEPRLPDRLHPGADERDELAEPEEPEVVVAQGVERTRHSHSHLRPRYRICGADRPTPLGHRATTVSILLPAWRFGTSRSDVRGPVGLLAEGQLSMIRFCQNAKDLATRVQAVASI